MVIIKVPLFIDHSVYVLCNYVVHHQNDLCMRRVVQVVQLCITCTTLVEHGGKRQDKETDWCYICGELGIEPSAAGSRQPIVIGVSWRFMQVYLLAKFPGRPVRCLLDSVCDRCHWLTVRQGCTAKEEQNLVVCCQWNSRNSRFLLMMTPTYSNYWRSFCVIQCISFASIWQADFR